MPRIVKTLFWRQTHRQTPKFPFFGAPKPANPAQDKEKRAPCIFLHTCSPGH